MNCPFEKLILEMDPEVHMFLTNLDSAICITDDLVDHKINSVKSMDVLLHLNVVTELALKRPGLYESIRKDYDTLLVAEMNDLNFIPMKFSNEENLMIWVKRGYRATVAFDCLCYLEPSFDTEDNRSWVLDTQTKGLILNDCSDILNMEFEDFRQVRRNYVALKNFNQNIYFTWRDEVKSLLEAADEVSSSIKFVDPPDERLKGVYTELRG